KHITVNGKILNIPSATVKVGDVISLRDRSKVLDVVQDTVKLGGVKKYNWLELNTEKLEGKYVELPTRDQIPENIKELLIVELYSK
ncbi:MAG TPA: S4 domain-containing protein, partial [Chitinophagales bacterium]|nr:S4 domain-containing protein [Chitinophagales bacterium]